VPVCDVPKSAFLPPPNVMSQVVRLSLRERPAVDVPDTDWFFQVVRASFAQRRKTLLNNLQALMPHVSKADLAEVLQTKGLNPTRRAETLSLEEFAILSQHLAHLR